MKPTETELTEALDEITVCPTCKGSGRFTTECYACISGEWDGASPTISEEICPECGGFGREFYGSEKAQSVFRRLE